MSADHAVADARPQTAYTESGKSTFHAIAGDPSPPERSTTTSVATNARPTIALPTTITETPWRRSEGTVMRPSATIAIANAETREPIDA